MVALQKGIFRSSRHRPSLFRNCPKVVALQKGIFGSPHNRLNLPGNCPNVVALQKGIFRSSRHCPSLPLNCPNVVALQKGIFRSSRNYPNTCLENAQKWSLGKRAFFGHPEIALTPAPKCFCFGGESDDGEAQHGRRREGYKNDPFFHKYRFWKRVLKKNDFVEILFVRPSMHPSRTA